MYWGPQNRYGEQTWWRPFREEIKRVKPEAFILGETDGTGADSEVNYADSGGDVGNLHDRTANFSPNDHYNHLSGEHAHYFRFLENHDEERIAQNDLDVSEPLEPARTATHSTSATSLPDSTCCAWWRGR